MNMVRTLRFRPGRYHPPHTSFPRGLRFYYALPGVPHIYARSEHDLFFVHGYCQAEDRLWQMEGLRRVAVSAHLL